MSEVKTLNNIEGIITLPEYYFDYSQPIRGFGNFTRKIENNKVCSIDRTIVKQKLELWDTLSKFYLNPDNDDGSETFRQNRAKTVLLLKDKTIFSYSNLKFDNKPLKLRWYQDVLLSDKGKRILFVASNQIGKSISLNVDASIEFCMDHGKGWVGILVSKTLPQSQYQMDRIKEILKSGNIDYKIEETDESKTGKKDNSLIITYTFYDTVTKKPKYTNRLICCPPTGSALGYPCDNIWLDEFEFWENIDHRWFMKQVAIPRTFETDGCIKVFSNPDGCEGALYQLWNEVVDGKHIWHRYNFNYWDREDATQEGFNTKSSGMTDREVESTLLAVFSRGEKTFFSAEEIKDSEMKDLLESSLFGKQPFFFLDVGAKHDQSVLVGGYIEPDKENPEYLHLYIPIIHCYPVGYPISGVVGSKDETSNIEEFEYHKSVKEYLDDFSVDCVMPLLGVDITGNSGISPLFNSVGIDPIDVTFSGPVKWGMYQKLKFMMEKRLLHRIKSKEFEYEFRRLQIKKTSRGYYAVHHENEDDLDDVPDSIAGLVGMATEGLGDSGEVLYF